MGTPVTIWRPSSGNGEMSDVGTNFIVDPSGNFLIDPPMNKIVDTGILFTQIPVTIWTEDNGA